MKENFTSRQLLHHDSFLRWKLLDDPDAKSYWENYIKENPDISIEVDEAENILKTVVRFNDYALTEQEACAISQAVQFRLIREKKKKRLKIAFQTLILAACIALAVFFNPFAGEEKKNEPVSYTSQNYPVNVDSKNIQMIIGGEECINFEEDADIKYDSSGNILAVNQKQERKEVSLKNKPSATINKLIVPKGRRSSLLLADGTKIWVNSGTTVEFPTVFEGNKREIKIDGEIYIEVAKDSEKPFLVNTSGPSVHVLGTRFNISSYHEDDFSNVVLVEGKVEILYEQKKMMLYPDQIASMQGENIEIKQVNVYDYISWKDGLLQFTSESLPLILKRLSRYYDVSITSDEDVAEMKCTGKLVLFDEIERVLGIISNTVPIGFKIDDQENILIYKKADVPL